MKIVDRLIVPTTFVIALAAVLAVTVSWVQRPPNLITLRVSMGPPGIVPGRVFGLRFTPRNRLSGHIIHTLIPSESRCVDVIITNRRLTYLDQRKACRQGGSYKLPYRFPAHDDYVVFVPMQPKGGLAGTYRFDVPLDRCSLRHGPTKCTLPAAALRGKETVRTQTARGLTVVLGAPTHAIQAGRPQTVSFVFLRHSRSDLTLQSMHGMPGDALAISLDTQNLVRLQPDAGQVVHGRVAGGAASFSGTFNRPSVYRVFGTFRYRGHPLRTHFVIDVDPAPKAVPAAQ